MASLKQALLAFAASGGNNLGALISGLQSAKQERIRASRPTASWTTDQGEGGGSGGPTQPLGSLREPLSIPRMAGPVPGVVRAAATQLGKPYVFGSGPSTASFDCSDLVQWAYKQVGISMPRDTYGQMRVLKPKSWSDLKPGDPIYRKNGGHVVLYAGNGKVLAAPHTGTVVQYQPLSYFTGGDYQPYAPPRR